MIRIHSHSPLIIIGLTAYYLIRKVSDGDTSSYVCKYTKILNTTKQNARKKLKCSKNDKHPGKEPIFSEAFAFNAQPVAATYLSPARDVPVPCQGQGFGVFE
jgi:hypothetical protein